ncbi:DDE-type integrase/transposase/recombinase [Amycolatopsis sp. NPDC005961]|uniref:DDE-type integrase/transposase/recombinase n=1 Tax=Amycolatopsis sp. NPDC005961 TaxID=3156720 RepID=UPI0033E39324
MAEAVLRARKELADEGCDNGPISIRWRLEDTGQLPLPSRASIHRILCAHGQIVAQPRKKPKTRRRFTYTDPNGCWQIDGTEHYLADGTKVCILQILDDHSRLDVGCYAATGETTTAAWAALQQAFAGYGVQGDRVTIMIGNTVVRQLTLDRSVRYQRLTNHKLSGTS